MMNRPVAALLLALGTSLALGAATAGTAHATTVLQVDLPELSLTSEWVVRARIDAVRSVDLRPNGTFATDYDLVISEVYRGQDVPNRYTLRLPGGEGADGMAMRIPGMPAFQQGEDVVLFLERIPNGGFIPCGLGQGVWRVHLDALGRPWVTQSLDGAHLMRRDAQGRLRGVEPLLLTSARPLEALVADVYDAQLP
ncbi:MAG: hypothetical protein H6744_18985 [Deltaproteobacteria bacterium]|nr:hypothetical protein [Deltaproteobacteria bacterium]MCB9788768.1 hypothetical protein [Deltaproteobacteria bacterium]